MGCHGRGSWQRTDSPGCGRQNAKGSKQQLQAAFCLFIVHPGPAYWLVPHTPGGVLLLCIPTPGSHTLDPATSLKSHLWAREVLGGHLDTNCNSCLWVRYSGTFNNVSVHFIQFILLKFKLDFFISCLQDKAKSVMISTWKRGVGWPGGSGLCTQHVAWPSVPQTLVCLWYNKWCW